MSFRVDGGVSDPAEVLDDQGVSDKCGCALAGLLTFPTSVASILKPDVVIGNVSAPPTF